MGVVLRLILKVFGEGIFCYRELFWGLSLIKKGKLIFDESERKIFILTKRKWAERLKKHPDLKVGILKNVLILISKK